MALFHYGGHGVQVGGTNYLLAVDKDIPDESKCKTRAIPVDEILLSMESSGSTANIIILDACRNNPLPGEKRASTRGLAPVSKTPKNSIIVYSADAGQTAEDGLFTPILIKHMQKKGAEITDVLRNVKKEIWDITKGSQVPAQYDKLMTKVFLTEGEAEKSETIVRFKTEVDNLEIYLNNTKVAILNNNDVELRNINAGDYELEAKNENKWYYKSKIVIIQSKLNEFVIKPDKIGSIEIDVENKYKAIIKGENNFIFETNSNTILKNLKIGKYTIEVREQDREPIVENVNLSQGALYKFTTLNKMVWTKEYRMKEVVKNLESFDEKSTNIELLAKYLDDTNILKVNAQNSGLNAAIPIIDTKYKNLLFSLTTQINLLNNNIINKPKNFRSSINELDILLSYAKKFNLTNEVSTIISSITNVISNENIKITSEDTNLDTKLKNLDLLINYAGKHNLNNEINNIKSSQYNTVNKEVEKVFAIYKKTNNFDLTTTILKNISGLSKQYNIPNVEIYIKNKIDQINNEKNNFETENINKLTEISSKEYTDKERT